jgi:hypothetical protein
MTVDRTISTILLVSFLVIAIPVALFFRKLPNAELTPTEKELINFSNQPVVMSLPLPQAAFSELVSPVRVASPKNGNITAISGKPITARISVKNGLPPSLGSRPSVSMIYYEGSTRMAIVHDHVVHEGSVLDNGMIVKIEKTRVLMRKAGKDIWLTTE